MSSLVKLCVPIREGDPSENYSYKNNRRQHHMRFLRRCVFLLFPPSTTHAGTMLRGITEEIQV